MPLSRLQNFLNNAEGYILYVNPTDFDSTDSVENRGNSLTQPFKTLQRALIEAARFSYTSGRNNDKNDRTTILVYPGIHYVDNRPGFSVQNITNNAVYKKRTSATTWTEVQLNEFSNSSNFDIFDVNNDLYKFNSVSGGIILPRGTSIIGLDLRKTKIRPLYVPDPLDDTVESSSIFNVTGTCYFSTFTLFDADPQRTVVKNYSDSQHVPNFSHHKLVGFAYADGVNEVLLGSENTGITDLDMYYHKVARAYGDLSGRGLVDFPNSLEFEPSIDEYRIVGDLASNALGISSIFSGNGVTPNNVITVTTSDPRTGLSKEHGLFVDSPITISGVSTYTDTYNGSFIVREVVGLTTFTFTTPTVPLAATLNESDFGDAQINVEIDNVSSASPYIFNCSLRSVYGMCGMIADGKKADGFKSMVVAQFTGVSLQKDNNAFLVYDNGRYFDTLTLPTLSEERPLYRNSKSIYKPKFENYHVKATNDGFIQCVSIFAIGYAKHFVAENGGDMSITNSNSNFGALSLESIGFRDRAFDRDDSGYITHIIPPKEIDSTETEVNWLSLDATKTRAVANSTRLYLFGYTNKDFAPQHIVDNFRVGSRSNDLLHLTITQGTTQTTHTARILMPVFSGTGISAQKTYQIARANGANSIVSTTGVITLSGNHQLVTGEKVRVYSESSTFPDKLSNESIYYVIRVNDTQIRLSSSLNDANSGNNIRGIGTNGGITNIISYVSDKFPGEVGHPIQYDDANRHWYINVSADNPIYTNILALNVEGETASSFIKRIFDNRNIEDRIYKVRYVIPKEFENARPPQAGFILQESSTVGLTTASYTGVNLVTTRDKRNEKIISNIVAGNALNGVQSVTLTTELPHNFTVGDKIKVEKVLSTNNVNGVGIVSTFNGVHKIISVPTSKTLTYNLTGVSINPGTFTNNVNLRNTRQQVERLPLVSRNEYKNNYFIYRVDTVRPHISGETGQDGVYNLIVMSSSSSLDETYGYDLVSKKFNQDVKNLYPQLDRDNFTVDPQATTTKADPNILGKVNTNDKKKSTTREFVNAFLENTNLALPITDVALSGTANTTLTLTLQRSHKFNSIQSFTSSLGANFSNRYSVNLTGGSGSNASFSVVSGNVSIVDPGTLYSVNDSGTITDGTVTGIITVTSINNNVGDAIELNGFESQELNTTYRILSIPSATTVVLQHPTGISSYTPNNNQVLPFAYLSADGVSISSLQFQDRTVGVVTVITATPHGLISGNKFTIVGSGSSVYDKTHIVSDVVGINTFRFNIQGATQNPTANTGFILKNGIGANSRSIGRGEESLNSRACYFYAGISATLGANLNIDSVTITLNNSNGFNRGDYVLVDGEIIRLISTPVGNVFNVQRGQFSTTKVSAINGSVVKKITVLPVELRRPSFLRASGHTFEYLGYGPGNYSTGMPQKQNLVLEEDRIILSQAREVSGGTVVYTGMNDLGEFYTGSKKLVSATGEEQVVDAPIITYTGDDAVKKIKNIQSSIFDELVIRDKITIEGGENNNEGSQFFGPVNFTNKITALSRSGAEVRNLYIRGTSAESKLITVGIQTPTAATIPSLSPGDISLLSNPSTNYIGQVYKNNQWRAFGLISEDSNIINLTVDRLGIGRTAGVDERNAANPIYTLDVSNNSRFTNLRIDGILEVLQPVTLGRVTLSDLTVGNRTNFNQSGINTISMIEIISNPDGGIVQRTTNNAVGILTFIGDFRGNATSSSTVSVATSDRDANHYLTFVNTIANGVQDRISPLYKDEQITYNPSQNLLTVPRLTASNSLTVGTGLTLTSAGIITSSEVIVTSPLRPQEIRDVNGNAGTSTSVLLSTGNGVRWETIEVAALQGRPGIAATITVGTVTTGDAGTQASVTNVGTASTAILNFVIPRGDKGDKGDKGDQGDPGPSGGGGTGTDTLDSVTDRGSTTTNAIQVSTATLTKNLVLSSPNTGARNSKRPLDNSGAIVWSTTNTDYAWIRFNSTSDSNPPSQLEIAVGDNGNSETVADSIVVNQYGYYGSGVSGPEPVRTFELLNNRGETTIPERLSVGKNITRDTNYKIQTFTDSGNSGILADINTPVPGNTCAITARNSQKKSEIGVVYNSSFQNPCGYLYLDRSGALSTGLYLWFDDVNRLKYSATKSDVGSSLGAVIGDQTSDERLKNIVGSIEYGLETIKQLNPVKYTFKSDPTVEKIGFIAQQVRDIIPESVYDTNEVIEGYEDGETKLAMEYVSLIPALVNAIKELDTENQQLKAKLTEELEETNSKIKNLENIIKSLTEKFN